MIQLLREIVKKKGKNKVIKLLLSLREFFDCFICSKCEQSVDNKVDKGDRIFMTSFFRK